MRRVIAMVDKSKRDAELGRTEIYADVAVLILTHSHYHSDSMEGLGHVLRHADEQSRSGVVVVDLSAVVLLSSTALRAMRGAHVALERRGGRIVAASGAELVRNVLKFAPFITQYDTVKHALVACSEEAATLYGEEN